MSALTQPAATILRLSPQQERQRERARIAQYQPTSDSFAYRFEDLSLPPSDIAEIMGPISGHAEIHYFEDEDGQWSIGEIRIDPVNGSRPVSLETSSWLYQSVYDALENDAGWNADICDAVRNRIEG